MSKKRCDSKLEALDFEQKRELCEWLLTPTLSYKAIVKLVFDEFNVSTSSAALSSFYQEYCGEYVKAERRKAVALAEEIGTEITDAPALWDAATIDALKRTAFKLANNPQVNPKDVKSVFSLVLKARDQDIQLANQEIAERRVRILEEKADKAKEALNSIASKGGLSPETLKQIEEAAALL